MFFYEDNQRDEESVLKIQKDNFMCGVQYLMLCSCL